MTQYMPLFRSCTNIRSLTQLHANLLVTGLLHSDPLPYTKLIESYAKLSTNLRASSLVFQSFPEQPDSFMWGVLIKCHAWNHLFEQAISLYYTMVTQQQPTQLSNFVFPSVLRACAGLGDLGIGEEVHGRIMKLGFDPDVVIQTSVVCMYGDLGCSINARKLFEEMFVRDVVAWSSVISSCVRNGEVGEGFKIYNRMVFEGVEPDPVTMISLAEACADLGCLRLARSVHGQVVIRKIINHESLDNTIVTMYSKCGDLCNAERIFANIWSRSVTSWTAIISSFNRMGCFAKALQVFLKMLDSKLVPNSVTLTSVLGSCARLGQLKGGKLIHCYVMKNDVDPSYEYLGPALIELYAGCGKLGDCEKVLHTIGSRNIVSWNMLISIYANIGLLEEALRLFAQMHIQGVMPDSFSLASSISACGNVGSVKLGDQMHAHVLKRGVLDEFVTSTLIDMYSKCGFIDSAHVIFNKIQHKTIAAWNSMLCGFSQNGNSVKAIYLFDHMYSNCLTMDEISFLSVIQACSNLGYLEKGKWLHQKLIGCGMTNDLYIDTALIDMYSKCGDLQTAKQIFNSMSDRSVVSWSAMINGYGMHGQIDPAISLFDQMVESGIKPNEVTFMNILSACSHSGCTEKGNLYFKSMKDFGLKPNSEHFACVIDLLSRAGELKEAYRIIKSMSCPVEASIWGALVNGCRVHQRMDIIKIIERDLLDISTDDTGFYTLLSNIYAEEGKWDKFGKLRSSMKCTGLTKVPGYSTIEIDKKVYRFGAGDMFILQTEGIYSFLDNFRLLGLQNAYDLIVEDYSFMVDSIL